MAHDDLTDPVPTPDGTTPSDAGSDDALDIRPYDPADYPDHATGPDAPDDAEVPHFEGHGLEPGAYDMNAIGTNRQFDPTLAESNPEKDWTEVHPEGAAEILAEEKP